MGSQRNITSSSGNTHFSGSEIGGASFYNMDNTSILDTFNDSFAQVILYFFYTGTDSKHEISSVTD